MKAEVIERGRGGDREIVCVDAQKGETHRVRETRTATRRPSETETERQRQRQRDRETETKRQRDRQTETKRPRDRERPSQYTHPHSLKHALTNGSYRIRIGRSS